MGHNLEEASSRTESANDGGGRENVHRRVKTFISGFVKRRLCYLMFGMSETWSSVSSQVVLL